MPSRTEFIDVLVADGSGSFAAKTIESRVNRGFHTWLSFSHPSLSFMNWIKPVFVCKKIINLTKVERYLTYKAELFFTRVAPARQLFNFWVLVLDGIDWKITIWVFFLWFFSTFIKLIAFTGILFSCLLFTFFNWRIKKHFLYLLSSLIKGHIILVRWRRVLGLIILRLVFSLFWSCRISFILEVRRWRVWMFLLAQIKAYMLLLFLFLVFVQHHLHTEDGAIRLIQEEVFFTKAHTLFVK